MLKKYIAFFWSAALLVTAQAHDVKVVTSFSILSDMVKQVGGDKVEVTSLVPANGDAHEFEPTPKDVAAFQDAKLYVMNGLGLDEWSKRLLQSSNFKGKVVVATQGIKPLLNAEDDDDHDHADHDDHEHHADHDHEHHHHGQYDPHAWQDLNNGVVYVKNITAGLVAVDPKNAAYYQTNSKRYIKQIQALNKKVKKVFEVIKPQNRQIVTNHDAFQYFGHAYGIKLHSALGISSAASPSAKEIAMLIDEIKAQHIPAIFVENIQNPKLLEQVAKSSGAKIGGTLYSDALDSKPPANTYLGMFESNLKVLQQAMKSE